MSSSGQKSIPLGGRYRQVSLYIVLVLCELSAFVVGSSLFKWLPKDQKNDPCVAKYQIHVSFDIPIFWYAELLQYLQDKSLTVNIYGETRVKHS